MPAKKTAAKPAPKPKKLWLTRDSYEENRKTFYLYKVHLKKPKLSDRDAAGFWYGMVPACFCDKEFEKYTSKALHLKPGGGPIPVKLVLDES